MLRLSMLALYHSILHSPTIRNTYGAWLGPYFLPSVVTRGFPYLLSDVLQGDAWSIRSLALSDTF